MLCLFLLVLPLIMVYKKYQRRKTVTELNNRHVFITGCDTGFGHLLALRLDEMGVNVYAGCLTEKGQSELREKASTRMRTIALDVTSADSIKGAVRFVRNSLPVKTGLWGLVNNAGVSEHWAPTEWIRKEDYARTLDVNMLGVIETTRQFLPLLREGKGRIVNMSSAVGDVPSLNCVPYCIAKHGVEVFSDCLRAEATFYGVTVHIIKPTVFTTNMTLHSKVSSSLISSYNHLEEEVKEFYGQAYLDKLIIYLKSIMKASSNLHLVTDACVHALVSMYPDYRYRVGPGANTFWRVLRLMPEWVFDRFYRRLIPGPTGALENRGT